MVCVQCRTVDLSRVFPTAGVNYRTSATLVGNKQQHQV